MKRRLLNDPTSMATIRNLQEYHANRLNTKWQSKQNRITSRIYQDIVKRLRNRNKLFKKLRNQARHGRNYICLTEYALAHPLRFTTKSTQEAILQSVMSDIYPILAQWYNSDLDMHIIESPDSMGNVLQGVYCDLYLFYTHKPKSEMDTNSE